MKTIQQPHWIYYTSIEDISSKIWSSALIKTYLWSTNDGNASWTVNESQGPWQGTKPASGRIANCFYSYFYLLFLSKSLFHDNSFIDVDTMYCSINNTNNLRLLVSTIFGVQKKCTGGQISSENNSIQAQTSVFVFLLRPLHNTDDWIASFYIASFKQCNYGNYANVCTHFISR